MEKDRILTQNHGVVEQAAGDETVVVNAETAAPGQYGRTEGGVPSGTPPSGPPAGAEARGGTEVEDSEEREEREVRR